MIWRARHGSRQSAGVAEQVRISPAVRRGRPHSNRRNAPAILLIAEHEDLAADLLVRALANSGACIVRFSQEDLGDSITGTWDSRKGSIVLRTPYGIFNERSVRSAWFRRFARRVRRPTSRASLVDVERVAFLDGIAATAPWQWINNPWAVSRAENKIWQLRVASTLGLRVPPTLIGNDLTSLRSFARGRDLVAKPLATSTYLSKGQQLGLYTMPISHEILQSHEDIVRVSPLVFQRKLEPRREWRITVVGNRVFAATLEVDPAKRAEVDIHLVPSENINIKARKLPRRLETACCQLVAQLGLLYGAIDLIEDQRGSCFFLEINPSGQWGWIEAATQYSITEALAERLLAGGPGETHE